MIAAGRERKAERAHGVRKTPLAGKTLAMIFDKPSTRTRVSFDVAMRQLGGETIMLTGTEMQPGRSEKNADTARVPVSPQAAPQPSAPSATLAELFARDVKDAFFDFNMADVRPDAREALMQTAEFLRAHPNVNVTIEGHCDERGSTEYNLGLGQRRAEAAKNYLISLGISADRMETVSWGKERPFCTEHNEECWQQNRRAHFVLIH